MSQRAENECSFAVDVGILSFTFNEALLCQKFSLYCFCCATAFTNVVLIDIYFEIMRTLVALAIMTILCMLYTVECV